MNKLTRKKRLNLHFVIAMLVLPYTLYSALRIQMPSVTHCLMAFWGASELCLGMAVRNNKSFFLDILLKAEFIAYICLLSALSLYAISFCSIKNDTGLFKEESSSGKNVVLVLGSKLHNNKMNSFLLARLDTLLAFINGLDKGSTCIIVSGGLGRGEIQAVTEAELMYTYLVSKGVPESMVIKEDKSVSTIENILFTQGLWRDCHLTVISSDFHLPRVKCILEDIGCGNYRLVGAVTDLDLIPFFAFEEMLGIFALKLGVY